MKTLYEFCKIRQITAAIFILNYILTKFISDRGKTQTIFNGIRREYKGEKLCLSPSDFIQNITFISTPPAKPLTCSQAVNCQIS